MKFIEVTEENLIKLLDNLRKEDKEEIIHSYKSDFRNKFIKASTNAKEKYFIADKNDNPLIIGGVEDRSKGKIKTGQVWLISSKYFTKSNLELIKFIKKKIEDFKNDYEILFNVIYKSNYKALKWLTKCGFKVIEINNKNYKLFYFTKGGINFDLRHITR